MRSRHDVLLPPFTISVDCHAGYRGEETPRRFRLGDDEVVVAEVLDQWLAPDHRYFRVLSAGGDRYILRHDVETNLWELTFFGSRAACDQRDDLVIGQTRPTESFD